MRASWRISIGEGFGTAVYQGSDKGSEPQYQYKHRVQCA